MSSTEQDNKAAIAGDKAALLQAVYSADICVLSQTPNLLYAWAENLPAVLRAKWRAGCADADIFPPAAAGELEKLKKQILAGGRPAALEVRLPLPPAGAAKAGQEAAALQAEARAAAQALRLSAADNGGSLGLAAPAEAAAGGAAQEPLPLWFKFSLEAQRDEQGKILGILTTGVNISALRAREEVLKVLLREVSHRSKNLLAIIQSIAAQTARYCRTIGSFLQKFQGRLHSLASSQDLVTDSDWRGAKLRDLIFAQTRFYTDAEKGREQCRVTVKGENPYLFPSAALHIGLALHELSINSASYGALAQGGGAIEIDCRPADKDNKDNKANGGGLLLSWRENFSSAAAGEGSGDNQARFGSVVLERIVPISVDGEAQYNIKNGYIEYFLYIPEAQFAVKGA